MKKLAFLLILVAGSFALTGCASPAYTSAENTSKTMRTWDYEYKQLIEDTMYEAMFDPPSRMTRWNLR
jgi:outer membrane biogenesis lipoprotein LolB